MKIYCYTTIVLYKSFDDRLSLFRTTKLPNNKYSYIWKVTDDLECLQLQGKARCFVHEGSWDWNAAKSGLICPITIG